MYEIQRNRKMERNITFYEQAELNIKVDWIFPIEAIPFDALNAFLFEFHPYWPAASTDGWIYFLDCTFM